MIEELSESLSHIFGLKVSTPVAVSLKLQRWFQLTSRSLLRRSCSEIAE